MARHTLLLITFPVILLAAPMSLLGAGDGEPVACISASRIDHTDIIDERHIAFFLKGGDIYVNQLDRNCPRLSNRRPFSYRLSTNRICHVDVITVLEDTGFGLMPGATCGLGMFKPADEEYVKALKGEDGPALISGREIKPDEEQEGESR